MAIAITNNSRGKGAATLRKTGSGADFTNTNLLANPNTSYDDTSEFWIQHIQWNVASGTVTIARGGNTVFEGGTSGNINLASAQMRLETGGDAAANLVITTAAAGTVLVTVHKKAGQFPNSVY